MAIITAPETRVTARAADGRVLSTVGAATPTVAQATVRVATTDDVTEIVRAVTVRVSVKVRNPYPV